MELTKQVVSKSLAVDAPPQRAFEVFALRFDSWWPRSHHTGDGDLVEAVIEPRQGGRWYATTTAGEEEWGRVLVWDPPNRLVLDWQLDADFKYDAGLHTDVEVRFIPESDARTRVEFEHRDLERYGDRAAQHAAVLGSEGGWNGLLELYAGELASNSA